MNLRYQPLKSPQAAAWRRQLDALRQRAVAWWKERTSQERKLLCVGSAVIAAALVWTLGLRPALDTIAQSRGLLPRLHADAAQVDALILEAQALRHRQSGNIDAADLSGALRASLRRAGLEASSTLSETRNAANGSLRQWEIVLFNANAAQAMEWLAGLPYLLHLQIQTVDLARANIDGRDRPGHVSGRIVVHQPAQRAP
jgi:general secretion pathway protein M